MTPDNMPGKLSTHVLDLTTGRPAAGMKIEIWRRDAEPQLLQSAVTDPDGRTASPLLSGSDFTPGSYELVFYVRDYFSARRVECSFLDQVPVRFTVTDSDAGYHVPLLVSPWAYSTYRGS